jgi:hypothetical protein
MRGTRMTSGIVCGLLAITCAAVSANGNFPNEHDRGLLKVRKAFEVTIRHRVNPLDPVIAVTGVLTLHVRPGDGRFVGTITPGYRVSKESPDAPATPLDSVLFSIVDGEFVSDPEVKLLKVDGQFSGRGVNMVIHDVLGPGQDIYAQGTTERYMGEWFNKDPGRIAGPAIGPLDGDSGDWAVQSETTCVRSVQLLPIAEDGSGGDVTTYTECTRIRVIRLTPVP